ncbi:hypothetical protein O181_054766 [Austropuccinia psidii MF-1]|uniref:Uncharacterized protein n=1 Tax=Austropuccinia psidii MF-1 TaxID=1389203 RepID=A0A9Q3HRG3_9BASI|nr:hypothetical protein [Austropuccinia psidii MF-1]
MHRPPMWHILERQSTVLVLDQWAAATKVSRLVAVKTGAFDCSLEKCRINGVVAKRVSRCGLIKSERVERGVKDCHNIDMGGRPDLLVFGLAVMDASKQDKTADLREGGFTAS